ncbi:hypothetical protein SAMN05192562_10739 [Kosakonia arachidis]|uniref:Uncharacterized protein n=1 Tax=Kosakonia arachidis TaxID=551989 RepID=A0A1I7DVI7_9ENTR|nr:hypothetical protein SAMN05192562_10739 [Kosakonia arachidis]
MYCKGYHFEPHVSCLSEDASLSDAHIMTRMIFFGNPVTTGPISSTAGDHFYRNLKSLPSGLQSSGG